MIDAPLAFAFAAGLVATVNPCGFAMLPAYISFFLGVDGADGEQGRRGGIARGLVVGAVVSAGFLLVFAGVGALVDIGLRSVIDIVPWVALAIGVGLVVLGAAMLIRGFVPVVRLPHLERGGRTQGYGSMFLFGISYALASLSCGLPIFLTVVAASTTAQNFLSGLVTFLAYGAGMSMLLIVVTLGLALTRDALLRRIRALTPYIGRISGGVLIVAGTYISAFWIANIRDPFAAGDPAFQSVEQVQGWITDQLGTRPGFWAVTLGALLVVAVLAALARSRSRPATDSPATDSPATDSPATDSREREPTTPRV